MSIAKLAQVTKTLAETQKKVADLQAELKAHEKRAEAEGFLLDMMQDPRAPLALRPSSVADFMAKRAAIEKQDLEVANLAANLAAVVSRLASTPLTRSRSKHPRGVIGSSWNSS